MASKVYASLFSLFTLTTAVVSAGKIDYHDRNIADDSIALAIKAPRPVSVTELVNAMNERYDVNTIEELDISENTICHKGAEQIFKSSKNYPNLRRINLAFNRIYDERNGADYQAFESSLLELLQRPTLLEIDLRGNGIANASWIAYMASRMSNNQMQKIKWAN
ncbi:MAG: hypothetical protein Q8K36_06150 [Alphaproteobacteria bacterium]|nr:hypothetical protein [Alphaproteobacteria bacterium]